MANSENFKVKNGLDVGAEANITNDLNLGGNLYLNGGTVTADGLTITAGNIITLTGDADTNSTTITNNGTDFIINAQAGAVPADIRFQVASANDADALRLRNDGAFLVNTTSEVVYNDSAGEGWIRNAYVFSPTNSRAMQVRVYNGEALALNRMGSIPHGDMVTLYKDGVLLASMGTESTNNFYFDNELGNDIKFKIGGTTNVQFQAAEVDFNVPLRFNVGAGNIFMHVEGVTDDTNETSFVVTDPTADRTITFQDASGTVAFTSDIVNQTITLSGDATGSGTTAITVDIASNVIGAAELNVTGNGTTSQYLRSDGDGSFTWATPTDTTYTGGDGLTLTGTDFDVDLTDTLIFTSTNTANRAVVRDGSGNFSAGTITAALSGNATSASSVTNVATFNNGGAGDASGTTFDGSVARTISYNTVGASPLAGSTSLVTTGTVTTGTWSGSFGTVSGANLTSLTAANISSGNLGSGVLPYATVDTAASAYKIPFLNTTGTASGNFGLLHDTTATFTYNPSTNTVTAGTFSGALSGNATTATTASGVAANSVALGTDTTGNYVATISGTANEIEVTGSGSENAAVTIGLPNNVTITGNLTVNGTTTTVNSTTITVDDPVFTLGGDTAPVADDNKDRGIEFRWYDGAAKVGFFGFDDSTGKFTFIPDATNTSEVFSGTKGTIDANIEWADILSKPTYDNYSSWSFTASDTQAISSGETVTFSGSGATTVTNTGNTITISSTDTNTTNFNVQANGGTQVNISAGEEVNFIDGSATTAVVVNQTNPTVTFNHNDTSTQASLTALTGANVVSDIDLDDYGHVTLLATRALTAGDIGAATSGHNHTLDSLSNVTITTNSSGEILKWSGTAWINNTLAEAGIQPAGSYLTGNQTITLSGDATGSGTTAITVDIAANVIGASELNVTGNGTTTQYLRSNGDGTFTWATPTDTNTTYSAGNGIGLSGTTFSVAGGTGLTQDASGLSLSATMSPAVATEMGAALDLNTLVAGNAGFYYQTANADTTGNNYPSNEAGSLIVQKSAGNATQMYQTYNTDSKLFVRSNYNAGWGTWQRVFADNYHPNADTWTTGRTITLTGDVTGVSGTFNGSGNLSFATALAANTVTSTELSSAVSLIIYNSAGTAVKTLYGSGS